MAPLSNICRRVFISPILQRNCRTSYRLLSTSGKKEDDIKACVQQETIQRKIQDFSKPLENKNWISYGYDEENKDEDTYTAHFTLFAYFTVIVCIGGFLYMYSPDRGRSDWAKREAFIRLHEREQLGLDPIDANYVDPAAIVLPPDEELLEEDIVI